MYAKKKSYGVTTDMYNITLKVGIFNEIIPLNSRAFSFAHKYQLKFSPLSYIVFAYDFSYMVTKLTRKICKG